MLASLRKKFKYFSELDITRSLAGLRPASCSLLTGASQSVLVQDLSKGVSVLGPSKVVLVQGLS